MPLFDQNAKYVKRIFQNEDGSETPVVRRVEDNYELNANGGVENGRQYKEEWNDPQFGQRMGFGAAIPGLLGGIFGGLAGARTGNGLQGALMGAMPGLQNAANIGGSMLEYYQPNSKLAAMGAGALSTGAAGLQQGLQAGLFNSNGNIGKGFVEGLAQGGIGALQGGVSAVPGMQALGSAIPGLAQGMANGNTGMAVSQAAAGIMGSPQYASMGNVGYAGDPNKYGVNGNWGSQIPMMTPQQANTGNTTASTPVTSTPGSAPVQPYGPKNLNDLNPQELGDYNARLQAEQRSRGALGGANAVEKQRAIRYANAGPAERAHIEQEMAAQQQRYDASDAGKAANMSMAAFNARMQRPRAMGRRGALAQSRGLSAQRVPNAPYSMQMPSNAQVAGGLMKNEPKYAAMFGRGSADYNAALRAEEEKYKRDQDKEVAAKAARLFETDKEGALFDGSTENALRYIEEQRPRGVPGSAEANIRRDELAREGYKKMGSKTLSGRYYDPGVGYRNAPTHMTAVDRAVENRGGLPDYNKPHAPRTPEQLEMEKRETQRAAANLKPSIPTGYKGREGTSHEAPVASPYMRGTEGVFDAGRHAIYSPSHKPMWINRTGIPHRESVPGYEAGAIVKGQRFYGSHTTPDRMPTRLEAGPAKAQTYDDRYSTPKYAPIGYTAGANQYRNYNARPIAAPTDAQLYAKDYQSPWAPRPAGAPARAEGPVTLAGLKEQIDRHAAKRHEKEEALANPPAAPDYGVGELLKHVSGKSRLRPLSSDFAKPVPLPGTATSDDAVRLARQIDELTRLQKARYTRKK